MNRTEKQTLIDALHTDFGHSPHAIVVDFRGLSVPAATEFRRKVRAIGSHYKVVKNRLAKRALTGTPLEPLTPRFSGTTGIAFTTDDPVALARTLCDFAKDNPALVVKGGVVSGSQLLDASGVKALSTMPSLPEMRSRLLGVLQAPASKLVRLLSTPATQMAQVLKAHQDKLEGSNQ